MVTLEKPLPSRLAMELLAAAPVRSRVAVSPPAAPVRVTPLLAAIEPAPVRVRVVPAPPLVVASTMVGPV